MFLIRTLNSTRPMPISSLHVALVLWPMRLHPVRQNNGRK